MKILTKEQDKKVASAVELANYILGLPKFYNEIRQMKTFSHATTTPANIATLIEESDLKLTVAIFFPRKIKAIKYRNTIAYVDSKSPNTLLLNKKKVDERRRTDISLAGTIIHEAIHALDNDNTDFSFGHGSNRKKGKDKSAPYWIGEKAIELLKARNS